MSPRRWREMSGAAKFRFSTRWTLTLFPVYFGIVFLPAAVGYPFVIAVIALTTVSAIAAVESRPELTDHTPRTRRILLWIAIVGFAVSWILGAVSEFGNESAGNLGVMVLGYAGFSLIGFLSRKWLVLALAGVATLLLYGAPAGIGIQVAIIAIVGAVAVSIAAFSMWSLKVVTDLEEAKDAQAKLHVAEERLRFSRDLHDVVGRGFSTIAVKSELASRLARSEAPGAVEKAAAEMDEVKALAVASMEEMRSLVRGYRGIDLAGEIAGARSLLDAAGCRLDVAGDPAAIPEAFHETAAWVVREGTTNIVRHSSARAATLALMSTGISLRNDGAPASPAGARSGLRGLSERLEPLGGTLETSSSDGEFNLEIRWEAS